MPLGKLRSPLGWLRACPWGGCYIARPVRPALGRAAARCLLTSGKVALVRLITPGEVVFTPGEGVSRLGYRVNAVGLLMCGNCRVGKVGEFSMAGWGIMGA